MIFKYPSANNFSSSKSPNHLNLDLCPILVMDKYLYPWLGCLKPDFAESSKARAFSSAAMIDVMDFDLNKREFRDAVRLRYDWPIPDNPTVCVRGSMFTVDHAMICQRRGLVIQRHNEIRDLQAELLDMVCYDVQVEPALQPITVNSLYSGHCRDLELVSSLARVRNSGSLFQSNVCILFLPGI